MSVGIVYIISPLYSVVIHWSVDSKRTQAHNSTLTSQKVKT